MGIIFAERGKPKPAAGMRTAPVKIAAPPKAPVSRPAVPLAPPMRTAATNMGPRGFTDVQKAQINKRLKAKVIKTIG